MGALKVIFSEGSSPFAKTFLRQLKKKKKSYFFTAPKLKLLVKQAHMFWRTFIVDLATLILCKYVCIFFNVFKPLQLYFGLLVFLGYMVVDTQEMIERAHHGDLDYVKHALTLFTDFVGVFVRILIIMVSMLCCWLWIVHVSCFRLLMLIICLRIVVILFMQTKNAAERSEKEKRKRRS